MTSEEQPASLGVLIVDDHDLYRTIALAVVDAAPGFIVVGSAGDRRETLQCLQDLGDKVDLVLMDVNLGPDDGVSLTAEISRHARNPDVVLVTALDIDDLPREALSCGARGYLPKAELSPNTLRQLSDGVYDWADGKNTGRAGR